MFKWLGQLAQPIADIYKARSERKREKIRLKHEVELERIRGKAAWEAAKTRRASESEGRDADWESQSIANSGWKDELVLLTLTAPMIAVFIPGLQEYVLLGFQHLASTPDWYRWLVLMIYAATFGIRIWRRKV